jgi:hypothetical protein
VAVAEVGGLEQVHGDLAFWADEGRPTYRVGDERDTALVGV